ncbi:hypothetical protein [Heliorestis convoluta]|uniref:Type I restriction endonuclease subunit M n=1 Tax=Heliorestis convoluta TaxID=356322 RepID=A0A5Q2N022_9FIRM|nr:hypothetical protein [Heliorestis convoluta]QGG46846.1 hypothetical protein FTV88_0668 [Heliorestis convoluta]
MVSSFPLVLFPLGQVYATPGVMDTIEAQDIQIALLRHHSGDWGDICSEDWELNNESLLHAGRLVSSYRDSKGKKFWIITEADRSATTVLLPEEY